MTRTALWRGLRHHGLVLAAYLLLAIALTWPLARDFSTRMIGHIFPDMRHAVWVTWYDLQALLGRADWPYTTLLYAPTGIPRLVDGVGPVNALLALPFWPWGPIAAFNGAALLGTTLSAWCLYLLARHVRLDRPAALFAGALFMAWPIHLSALYGHLEKLFTGLLPLAALAGLLAFDPRRSRWTMVLPGLVMVAALLQNGNQFTFTVIALAVLGSIQIVTAPPPPDAASRPSPAGRRWAQAGRVVLVGVISIAICLPVLLPMARLVDHPDMTVALGDRSSYYMPDAWQFLLPSIHQALPARWIYPQQTVFAGVSNAAAFPWLVQTQWWYGSGVETSVNAPLTALALVALAWMAVSTRREAFRWTLIGLVFTALAMGPLMRVAGIAWVPSLPMPQALLMNVHGFDVMRTPGRYMMMGSVGLALAAGLGLTALARWRGRIGIVCAAIVSLLAMVECWPAPWPQHAPPPVPRFYQQIAQDPAPYAVLDLPAGWPGASGPSSAYHYYQMTHRKPIAWGNLSRDYSRYPTAGLASLWNPQTTDYADTRRRLARLGFRYVVWHKHAAALFDEARDQPSATSETVPRAPGVPATSHPFIRTAFADETPAYDDELVTVYRVDGLGTEREPALRR